MGLAAPQVGVNVRLMVYNPEGEPGKGKEYTLVNPRIVERSEELDWFEEGCLSFPQMFGDVERPVACTVKVGHRLCACVGSVAECVVCLLTGLASAPLLSRSVCACYATHRRRTRAASA